MERHLARHGSQRQIQDYVNEAPGLLQQQLAHYIPELQATGASLEWSSPVAGTWFAEFRDRAFIETLGLGIHADALADFWPRNGPCWDALAVGFSPLGPGEPIYLLVEAKSHTAECRSDGCKAEKASLLQIERSLDRTATWLGTKRNLLWTTTYYQYMNRLAHLYFLRDHLKANAWLVNVYFCNDPFRPTAEQRWRDFSCQIRSELGLPATLPYVVDLCCPSIQPMAPPLATYGEASSLPVHGDVGENGESAKSILAGLDDIVDQALGVGNIGTTAPHYRHKTSCLKLRTPRVEAVSDLLNQMYLKAKSNWSGRVRGSGQNWRWEKVVKCVGKSNEVDLAKWISAVTDYDWVNAVPTASGLMPHDEEKHRNIDLAHRVSEGVFELIELKVERSSDTPLSAAIQILQYFVLYALARTTIYGSDQTGKPLLAATQIHLQVLAPEGFYRGYNNLTELERVLDKALVGFNPDGLNVKARFRFTRFPSGFRWPEATIEELKAAIANRSGL